MALNDNAFLIVDIRTYVLYIKFRRVSIMDNTLALFEEKEIRKTWKDNKWYFSVEDVVYALTDSKIQSNI